MRRLMKPADLVNLHRGQNGWYQIKNAAGAKDEAAEIYIYGYIGWDVTANEFIKDLRAISADKIVARIATNGGDVFDGIAIMNAMRAHPATITTIVDSQALSAGSFIMQAGDTRQMMPNTTVMIHDALTMGAWAEGNASDMRQFAKEIEKFADQLDAASDNIASIYAEKAGGTAADWRKVMQEEKWYTAEQAVEAGLADEVIDLKAKNAKAPKIENVKPADDTIDWDAFLKEAAL